jgi:acyl carrier protein
MTKGSMEDLLREFLEQEILDDLEGESIGRDEDLLQSGLVDSIGMVRLAGFIEERFNYKVPPEDFILENFQSVAALCSYLGAKVSG